MDAVVLAPIDWVIIVIYFAVALFIGVFFSRRASKSIDSYFVADRKLPWWIAGTSMVATSFAADTPLAITGIVAENGIAGNWFWWMGTITYLLVAFVFAKFWRRSRVMTDAELIELRYDGKSAAALRGFKAFYFSIVINCVTMGWVILAMGKIMRVIVDWSMVLPPEIYAGISSYWPAWFGVGPSEGISLLVCILIALIYCTISGMWGVVATDVVQFVMAMTGAVALAYFAVKGIGGLDALVANLNGLYGSDSGMLDFFPSPGSKWMPLTTFFLYIGVLWWAQKWSDGGGYIVQRILSTKNEEHAEKSTLWFGLAHCALRPWPWILVALVALVVYPKNMFPGMDREMAYPMLMAKYLPAGLLGIMVTSLLAAFMSTIDTHLNWGASYIVDDVYRRFIKPDASPRHYVAVSRISVIVLAIIATMGATYMTSVADTWKMLLAMGSGIGLVHIARWFWWRVSAASEITAIVVSTITAAIVYVGDHSYSFRVITVVLVSTVAWVAVTLLMPPPNPRARLEFYKRVRPSGFWRPVEQMAGTASGQHVGLLPIYNWVLGIFFVYGTLYGIGCMLLKNTLLGAGITVSAWIVGAFVWRQLGKREEKEND